MKNAQNEQPQQKFKHDLAAAIQGCIYNTTMFALHGETFRSSESESYKLLSLALAERGFDNKDKELEKWYKEYAGE